MRHCYCKKKTNDYSYKASFPSEFLNPGPKVQLSCIFGVFLCSLSTNVQHPTISTMLSQPLYKILFLKTSHHNTPIYLGKKNKKKNTWLVLPAGSGSGNNEPGTRKTTNNTFIVFRCFVSCHWLCHKLYTCTLNKTLSACITVTIV